MPAETDILPPRYLRPVRIGRGGMGDIYRAEDELLGRVVAVKLLSERYSEDDAVRQRFTREALTAARLSNAPSTVTIFDVGEWNDRPFIVMEYLSGGSLADRLAGGAQPAGQALEWLEQAAAALDAAHGHGVVHRDVKPANLLLDDDERLHVADFGIASAAGLDSFTAAGTVLGTAGYLSPEQARGERADAASDRYALGIMAYELLTGRRPFENESPTAEAAAHVSLPVPRISEAATELPRELDEVFQRALAKEPADRHASCTELVWAIRAALAESAGRTRVLAPLVVAPTTRVMRQPGRRARAPLVIVALVALGLAGAALAGIVLSGGEEQATAPDPSTVRETITTLGTTLTVVTTAPAATVPPDTTPEPAPPAESPSARNDAGYALMQQDRFDEALPLLEQAVDGLSGSGELAEAYASYNLAYTRLALGSCDGVLDLLDRSAEIQGELKEIRRLRKDAEKGCED